MDWNEFQAIFVERWYLRFMAPELRREAEPLIEYVEPINSRISRRAEALDDDRQQQFEALQRQHLALATGFQWLFANLALPEAAPKPPVSLALPLRRTVNAEYAEYFGAAVLDAEALRPLLEAVTTAYSQAITEFDEVFGGRA